MAGRRDFLKRFGIGIAAAPVAVQVAEAALTAPAKVAQVPVPPKAQQQSVQTIAWYPNNGVVTTTTCMNFTLAPFIGGNYSGPLAMPGVYARRKP